MLCPAGDKSVCRACVRNPYIMSGWPLIGWLLAGQYLEMLIRKYRLRGGRVDSDFSKALYGDGINFFTDIVSTMSVKPIMAKPGPA